MRLSFPSHTTIETPSVYPHFSPFFSTFLSSNTMPAKQHFFYKCVFLQISLKRHDIIQQFSSTIQLFRVANLPLCYRLNQLYSSFYYLPLCYHLNQLYSPFSTTGHSVTVSTNSTVLSLLLATLLSSQPTLSLLLRLPPSSVLALAPQLLSPFSHAKLCIYGVVCIVHQPRAWCIPNNLDSREWSYFILLFKIAKKCITQRYKKRAKYERICIFVLFCLILTTDFYCYVVLFPIVIKLNYPTQMCKIATKEVDLCL